MPNGLLILAPVHAVMIYVTEGAQDCQFHMRM